MVNKVDKYILKCIKEGKISTNPQKGTVYSHYAKRDFKQMVNWAGYHYLDFKYFGERWSVLVHRVIWVSVHGEIPDGCEIDHRNRNPSDNRISNLRAVTHQENCQNKGGQKNGE